MSKDAGRYPPKLGGLVILMVAAHAGALRLRARGRPGRPSDAILLWWLRSCAAWLSWRVGLDMGAARERVRVAHALETLPRVAAALARGELSYAKVRAVTRVATPDTEERLLAVARAGTAAQVEQIVRGWRRVDRHAEARESAHQHTGRALHVYPDDDGMMVLRGRLAPDVGALLLRALAAARETLYQQARRDEPPAPRDHPAADPPTTVQQQADALALLAETALHHGLDPGAPGERYQVVVHVDAAVLADPDQPGQSVLEDGPRVPAETSRRLACDASRVVMTHDEDGRLVEVGARTRTIPPALRRALHHRDRGGPLSGLRRGVRAGPSRPALGGRRAHDAVESRAALSPAPSRGPRGGLSGRSTAGRRPPVPAAGRPTAARGPASDRSAGRSGPGPARRTRRPRPPPPRADRGPGMARRAPQRGLGDRCPAPSGRRAPADSRDARARDRRPRWRTRFPPTRKPVEPSPGNRYRPIPGAVATHPACGPPAASQYNWRAEHGASRPGGPGMDVLGIDIGGVIIDRVSEDDQARTLGPRAYTGAAAVEGALEAIARLGRERFHEHVWLVSRCDAPREPVLAAWLEQRDFFGVTGVARGHVIFCRERHEKAALCRQLGVTHFIDDRLEVLSHLVGMVPHLYLFRSRASDVDRFRSFLPQVRQIDRWTELVETLLGHP